MEYAKRMAVVPRSFIREILKVTQDPSIISFAGGLPNPRFFPAEAIKEAAIKVMEESGASALQYATTEGHPPLREWIAARYRSRGMPVDPHEVIVTTGSQQGLDMIGKVFLDPGDAVIMERPGYLGAIQAFSMFEPRFVSVPLEDDGVDVAALSAATETDRAKIFYAVPTFQNPSGATYSLEKRRAAAAALRPTDILFVEDDPYGELRFHGTDLPMVSSFIGGRRIMLGTFSKIAAPGFRIGWIVADKEAGHKLVTAKQASDLHTSILAQAILHRFLADNDLDEHIQAIRTAYGRQRDLMVSLARELFPPEVRCTEPEGGMFLWVTLPSGCSAMDLFHVAVREKVAFVPGRPFYVGSDDDGDNTLRLNFSNSDEARIEEGMRRLAACLREYLAGKEVADPY